MNNPWQWDIPSDIEEYSTVELISIARRQLFGLMQAGLIFLLLLAGHRDWWLIAVGVLSLAWSYSILRDWHCVGRELDRRESERMPPHDLY